MVTGVNTAPGGVAAASVPVPNASALNMHDQLVEKLGGAAVKPQRTADGIPTFWIARESAHDALAYLKEEVDQPYRMLYDLTAIDERMRVHPEGAAGK